LLVNPTEESYKSKNLGAGIQLFTTINTSAQRSRGIANMLTFLSSSVDLYVFI